MNLKNFWMKKADLFLRIGMEQQKQKKTIKEKTKATIRCIPLNNKQEDGKCILTGKPSKERVLFARAY